MADNQDSTVLWYLEESSPSTYKTIDTVLKIHLNKQENVMNLEILMTSDRFC